jgi:hypothetical protein
MTLIHEVNYLFTAGQNSTLKITESRYGLFWDIVTMFTGKNKLKVASFWPLFQVRREFEIHVLSESKNL